MAETTTDRAQAIRSLLSSVEGEPPDVKAAVLQALVAPPDQKTSNALWTILVTGLLGLIGIALVGLLLSEQLNVDADKIWAAGGALLTGLIGLFAKSPPTEGQSR